MTEPLEWYNLPHLHFWSCLYMTAHSDFAKRALLLPDNCFAVVKLSEVPRKHRVALEELAEREKLPADPEFVAMTNRDGRPGLIAGWYKCE